MRVVPIVLVIVSAVITTATLVVTKSQLHQLRASQNQLMTHAYLLGLSDAFYQAAMHGQTDTQGLRNRAIEKRRKDLPDGWEWDDKEE